MPTDTSQATEEILARTITAMAGPEAQPRPDQIRAVVELVEHRRRVLVVQATGWGKSAVYWAATAALRQQGAGPTLVVSPLLALMRDQIAAAARAGLQAATINSTNPEEWQSVLAEVRGGNLDVLLISPERLANPAFAAQLPHLLEACGLLVIDEAHCVSDWGFDFRPDYQRLTRTLLALAPGTPVLATTATANQRVTADVAAQLGADTVTLRGSLARASLRLAVVPGLSALERYAWVADALRALPGSGIVYVLTVAETERVAEFLRSLGLDVAAYSGQTTNREELEDRLRRNEVKALVATSALGMGYDKPDLAFCVHLGSPASPVAYYQQVGRAGRALDDALAVLVPAESDERIWQYFATAGIPDEPQMEQILDCIGAEPPQRAGHRVGHRHPADAGRGPAQDPGRRRLGRAALRRLGRDGSAVVLRRGQVGRAASRPGRRGRPDAPVRLRCGVPDGVPPAGPRRPRPGSVRPVLGVHRHAARRRVARPDPATVTAGLALLPRPRRRDRAPQAVGERAAGPQGQDHVPRLPGRALAFADDPAWSADLSKLWQSDRPAPPELLAGLVEALRRWSRSWERPVAVVPMPSRRFPVFVRSLAAAPGRGRPVAAWSMRWRSPDRRPTRTRPQRSGPRICSTAPGSNQACSFDGPVLLVDDTVRSRWTMTVAGALLAEAGATSVLPLAVHLLP